MSMTTMLTEMTTEHTHVAGTVKRRIIVCSGTGCVACGAVAVHEAFLKCLGKTNLRAVTTNDLYTEETSALAKQAQIDVRLSKSGCKGFCQAGPLVTVEPEGILYTRVKPEDVDEIVKTTIVEKGTVDRLLYVHPETQERCLTEMDIPFYHSQKRIALKNCGRIDPEDIREYIAVGGYAALQKALTQMTPDAIIETIKKSGLRGRGGGGFPTGRKWETCRKASGEPKYIICNADEGDPGAYMDRAIIEGDPHSVIEGMIIGSYAIGSHIGYIYVRQEYPLAVKRLRLALKQAEEAGLLGDNILGSGHSFTIQINRGAGAFVCGESTALMASLEGRVGEPRAKYIHTVEFGLNNKPSCLNNVETWNNVPVIIARGADWYASIGTETSKGTKVFSLVGKAKHVGLVEVPMGTTLREVVEEIGGGVPEGGTLKAVQTGGPSGGCIPASCLDAPVDYESLSALGSMMGSGGLVVMDSKTCMVDVARYFIAFLKDESCGKCVPCREGASHTLEILNRICGGEGRPEDLELLEDLSTLMTDGSLCALGGSAANPVLSTLKYFADEYRAHIEDKRCPAGVCKGLMAYRIDPDACVGCGCCVDACPCGAIEGEYSDVHVIDEIVCSRCGLCVAACDYDAIRRE